MNFINLLDKISYFSTKLIKKVEKKFSISLHFLFPLRLFLRLYEKIFFKKINNKFQLFSNYYLPTKLLEKKNVLVISGGIGFDISFEKVVLEKINISKMILFDPIELCDEVKEFLNHKKISYFKKALYSESKKMKIYKPFEKEKNPNVSLNILHTDRSNYQIIKTVGIIPVLKFAKFKEYKNQVIKLHIEGVADLVIIKCIKNSYLPCVINFELERPTSIFEQFKYFKRLFELKKVLEKEYSIFYYTSIKLGYRLELIAVKKNSELI